MTLFLRQRLILAIVPVLFLAPLLFGGLLLFELETL
jgi:hypothetical protein